MQRSEGLVLSYVNVSGRPESLHDSIHMHAAGVVSWKSTGGARRYSRCEAIIGLKREPGVSMIPHSSVSEF
jgi:hypothetical protein